MSESNKTWFAAYVKSRAEKKVALELEALGIEFYLPLTKKLKQWSDRRKWVEEPLFRSYIFVHIDQSEYFTALNANGVVRYVSFGGKAVAIPEVQIKAIQYYLEESDPSCVWQRHFASETIWRTEPSSRLLKKMSCNF